MKRTIRYAEDKVRGLLFGTVIGDTLGAGFEGQNPDQIPPLDEKTVLENSSGVYTDDTQMTISVFEEMVEHGSIQQSSLQKRIMSRFSRWRGYGGGMLEVIEHWNNGIAIDRAARAVYNGAGNFGDGAAMRIAPISAFFRLYEREEFIEQVIRCSTLTHTHSYGISGSVLQAYAVLLALNEIPVEEWLHYFFELPLESAFKIKMESIIRVLERQSSPLDCAKIIGNGAEAMQAVPSAICAAMRNPSSFIDTVLFAIGIGGDTDTIGAMAGAIAGARFGYRQIPSLWIKSLENDYDGRDFIESLISRGYGED